MTSSLDYFNPLRYMTTKEYVSIWDMLFSTFLMGFWSRFFASSSLILTFWCGVVRQKIALAIIFFSLTVFFTYFGGMTKIIFWWLW